MAAALASSERRLWRYVAEKPGGELLKGEVAARDENEAVRQVQALGAAPLEVKPVRRSTGVRGKLSNAEAAQLVRGIADLVTAGLPLKDTLASLAERETRPRLKAVIERLDARLKGGDSFSAALRADPAGLPRPMMALAEAGEESGLLGRNYTDLAEQMERDESLRQEVTSQMIYPGALFFVMVLTLIFLAHFVLPQFDSVFADARMEPPAITTFVLNAGAFLRDWAAFLPAGLVVILLAARTAARMWPLAIERFIGLIPLLGATRFRMEAVRYCRVLGLLLSAGSPLARAETVARDTIGPEGLRQRHALAAEAVRAGESMSEALARYNALPDDALRLISLGEKSGNLDAMLLRAAEYHDREARTTLKRAVELISPLMIVILALCVGGVIAAVMLGVLSLNEIVF